MLSVCDWRNIITSSVLLEHGPLMESKDQYCLPISGFQIFTVSAPGITEEVPVILKQNEVCIVEASDDVPRQIDNCPYEQGEQITITYKREQPSIESHRPT
ncbi:MAG TPA: hypothetical protein VD694_05250 [Nitrososphaeraceae archaeon]|nr:hypothetical protein [Nitrososphaeraceae archaeon]